MIESSQKIWSGWVNKTTYTQGLTNFSKGWHALMMFLEQEPEVTLECDFMWNLMLTVRSTEASAIPPYR
eukprot:2985245-Heterocapsa_arctica.AAC.1